MIWSFADIVDIAISINVLFKINYIILIVKAAFLWRRQKNRLGYQYINRVGQGRGGGDGETTYGVVNSISLIIREIECTIPYVAVETRTAKYFLHQFGSKLAQLPNWCKKYLAVLVSTAPPKRAIQIMA